MHGYTDRKDEYNKRLRRIEGQVRGLQRMVEEDKYCIDILTQISAATKALQSVALGLLEEHVAHCVADALATGGPEADAKVKEANEAIARLVRSRADRPRFRTCYCFLAGSWSWPFPEAQHPTPAADWRS